MQISRTPLVEAIINENYKGEYGKLIVNPIAKLSQVNMDDDQGSHHGDHHVQNQDRNESSFGFPILDVARDIVMKNIHPSILPMFHGMPI